MQMIYRTARRSRAFGKALCLVLLAAGAISACSRSDKTAPVPQPLPATSAPAAGVQAAPQANTPADVVKNWDKAHNDHDAQALGALYAPNVEFYGQHLSNAQVIAAKDQAFKRDPAFKQQLSNLKIEEGPNDATATFSKDWFANGKAHNVDASLQLGTVDGRLLIVKESDVTVGAAKAGPPATIKCGDQVCSKVCCASFDHYTCADDPGTDCERATNGEARFWRCDGPEDCAGGEVCCGLPDDRVQVVACAKPDACTGAYTHPRYETVMPRRRVCHDDTDCPRGLTCRTTDDWVTKGLSVYR
jgi:hypothetical protein